MGYGLGIDLGTTYTAAAINVDGRVDVVRLGSRRPEIPSLVFLRPDGGVLVGEAAQRRGQGEPGRLAREFKRRLGDPVPIMLGGAPFSAHALTARLLGHVVETVTRQQEAAPERIVVTHPANWGPYKRELLVQATHLAELTGVLLRPEPEAAAVRYAGTARVAADEIVAVYDLGGGTFDAAVLRKSPDGFALLGEPEGIEQLGGIDFDEAVLEYVRTTLGDALAGLDPDDEEATEALARLRRDCVEAKESLSDDTEAVVPVALPRLHTRVRINRSQFEAMITPALRDTVAAVRRALRSAEVRPEQLRGIVLAGGSSRIPLVSQLLSTAFERPVVLDESPELGIALGAAMLTGSPVTAGASPSSPGLANPGPGAAGPGAAGPADVADQAGTAGPAGANAGAPVTPAVFAVGKATAGTPAAGPPVVPSVPRSPGSPGSTGSPAHPGSPRVPVRPGPSGVPEQPRASGVPVQSGAPVQPGSAPGVATERTRPKGRAVIGRAAAPGAPPPPQPPQPAHDTTAPPALVAAPRFGWLTYRWSLVGAVVATLIAITAAATWPRGEPRDPGPAAVTRSASAPAAALGVVWRATTGRPATGPPLVSADHVFVGGTDGVIRALNRSDGRLDWAFPAGSGAVRITRVIDDMVYGATADGTLLAVDAGTGQQRWRERPGTTFDAGPAVYPINVYIGGRDSYLYAYPRGGERNWRKRIGGTIRTSPIVAADLVVVAGGDGRLYGVDNGRIIWQRTVGQAVDNPSTDNNVVCVAVDDGSLRCFEAADGAPQARIALPAKPLSAPISGPGVVYAAAPDGTVGAWDSGTAQQRWLFRPKPGAAGPGHPAIQDRVLYVSYPDGRLASIDGATGTQRWDFDVDDRFTTAPRVNGTQLFVVGATGTVHALRLPPA